MKNNIETRKKILNKIAEKEAEKKLDENFADALNSNNIDSALDDYVDMLLAIEISHAFLDD